MSLQIVERVDRSFTTTLEPAGDGSLAVYMSVRTGDDGQVAWLTLDGGSPDPLIYMSTDRTEMLLISVNCIPEAVAGLKSLVGALESL